jgi:hypothetical protein
MPFAAVQTAFEARTGGQVSGDIVSLLKGAGHLAGQLREDASDLVSMAHRTGSPAYRSEALTRIRRHIDAAELLSLSLDGLRPGVSFSDARTIDRINPMLRGIATATAELIRGIDENPRLPPAKEHRGRIESHADMVSQTAATILAVADSASRPRGM